MKSVGQSRLTCHLRRIMCIQNFKRTCSCAEVQETARSRAGIGFRAASFAAGSVVSWFGRISGASSVLATGAARLSDLLRSVCRQLHPF